MEHQRLLGYNRPGITVQGKLTAKCLIRTFTPLTVPAKKAREFMHFSKIPAGEQSEQATDVKECSLSSYMLS